MNPVEDPYKALVGKKIAAVEDDGPNILVVFEDGFWAYFSPDAGDYNAELELTVYPPEEDGLS